MPRQTQLIIGAAILILIVVAVGAYFMFGKVDKAPTTTDVASDTQQADESQTTSASIKSLLSGNKNVMCTVKYPPEDGVNGEGTVYVSANKMRGDFTMMVDNQSTEGHMISDGEYMYSWSSQVAQGTKMKLDAADQKDTQKEKSSVDINQQVNLDCSNWSVDNSKFDVPSDITFTDITQSLNQMQQQQSQSPQSQPQQSQQGSPNLSSVCDYVTDPQQKAECLKELGN